MVFSRECLFLGAVAVRSGRRLRAPPSNSIDDAGRVKEPESERGRAKIRLKKGTVANQ